MWPEGSDRLRQLPVVLAARRAPDLAQAVIRNESYSWRRLQSGLYGVVQVRGREDNQVPVPNRRYRKTPVRIDADMNSFGAVLYGPCSFLLERQKRVLHGVLVVPPRRFNSAHSENFKLDGFTHAPNHTSASDTPRAKPSKTALFPVETLGVSDAVGFGVLDAVSRGIGCRSVEFT
jgi:hypothetical protein